MATVRTRIGPADHGRQMTLEEFREADEEPGYLYELARGVLEVSEVPGIPHWHVLHNLHDLIGRHGWRHPGLISLIGHGSEFRFVIPGLGSDRHPDLVVVFRGAELDENGRPRPSLAVEIVSPGSVARKRDYESKREEYLTVGLREYWIVDPKLRQVTVLTYRVEDGIATWAEAVFQGEELIASGLLPGFDGTVAALWLDVD